MQSEIDEPESSEKPKDDEVKEPEYSLIFIKELQHDMTLKLRSVEQLL